MVEEIARVFEILLEPGGSITVLEYLGLRKLSLAFASPERRDRLEGVERVIQQWRRRVKESGKVRTRVSFLNLPPALAIQFRYKAEYSTASEAANEAHGLGGRGGNAGMRRARILQHRR